MTPEYAETVLTRLRRMSYVDENGCWRWTAARNHGGYGVITLRPPGEPKAVIVAHRVAYQLLVGRIPEGLQLDHLCRVHDCINPEHLEPVTHDENQRRGVGPVGVHARTGACKRGHPWPENAVVLGDGRTQCGPCRRLSWRQFAQRRRSRATVGGAS